MRKNSKLTVVVGGQYGSEGKGHVAAQLTKWNTMTCRVAGPNAGHTVHRDGHKYQLRQIPAAAVCSESPIIIAQGSEIDLDVLEEEVELLDSRGLNASKRLHIDPQATIIRQQDKDLETELVGRIGSTGKGIGAARAARLMREAPLYGEDRPWAIKGTSASELMMRWMTNGGHVLIEGTQGYGLGLHAGDYPQCTSSDCTAIDMLSMAGLSPWDHWIDELQVVVVLRVYPIRVAGESGPLEGETSWEALGLNPEYTTVTKLERRVGQWDADLAMSAVNANGGGAGCEIALTMVDQILPDVNFLDEYYYSSVTDLPPEAQELVGMVEAHSNANVRWLGVSPNRLIKIGDH